jgi:hypothetical protein
LWLGLLLLTLLAGLWPVPQSDIPEGSAERKPAARGREVNASLASLGELGALRASAPVQETAVVDLFPRQSWVPPSPSPRARKPETPAAPPLPFSYGGRYTEGDKVFVFLKEDTNVHTAREGETVRGSYRVDKIGDAEIAITYLPLGEQQSLPTGSMSPRE